MKLELLVIAVYHPAVNLSLRAVQIAHHARLDGYGTNNASAHFELCGRAAWPLWPPTLFLMYYYARAVKGRKVVTKVISAGTGGSIRYFFNFLALTN